MAAWIADSWRYFGGLVSLLLVLGPFLFAQRWLHLEIQWVLLLITRREQFSLGVFALLFFPGVLLHETSHYLMARLLGVATGRFSLIPSLIENGKLRLGFVETSATDLFRDGLIGAAPLLSGGAAVAFLGVSKLGVVPVAGYAAQANWPAFCQALWVLPAQPDFWLWFYLAFTISSTMLPSASDRRAWLPVTLVVAALIGLALLVGAGPWILQNLAPWLDRGLRVLAAILGGSLVLHLLLLLPFRMLRGLISALTGLHLGHKGTAP